MPAFDRARFHAFILEHAVIGFHEQPLTLKSGRLSHFYVNWRTVTNDAFLLDRLTDFIVAYLQDSGLPCRTLYGVPEGATKTAVVAGLKWARTAPDFALGSHTVAMGRAKPKAHGSPADRDFIGMPQGPTVVLEDTTTTGGSVLTTLTTLHAAGVEVVGVITLTDRQERRDDGASVGEAIARVTNGKVAYRAMTDALTLLPAAARQKGISPEVRAGLEAEFRANGVGALEWGTQ